MPIYGLSLQYYPLLMQAQEPEEQPEQEQEQMKLTPQLVHELQQLLPNNMFQVRHGTLSAILQYTASREDKLMFKEGCLITCLRKYLFEPQLTKISLSTLIHFATEAQFVSEIGMVVEPLVLKMKEWKALELELALLLLLNLSKDEQVIFRMIGEEEKRGYLMEILFALLEKEEKVRWIIVGIFVDVSAVDRGRRFLVEDGMGVRFLEYLNASDEKLREASLKIVRNCSFEYEHEPFAEELLKAERGLFPSLIKLLTFLIYKQQLIHDLTHTNLLLKKIMPQQTLLQWKHKLSSTDKSKALAELELGIDILLVLANVDLKQRDLGIKKDYLFELLTLLKFTDIKEATKDKLQALEIFAF